MSGDREVGWREVGLDSVSDSNVGWSKGKGCKFIVISFVVSGGGAVEEGSVISPFAASTSPPEGSAISGGGKGTGMLGVAEDGKLVKGECDCVRR